MFISMTTIRELFGDYETALMNSTSTHFLSGWERLREAARPLDEGRLYVADHISELEAIDPGELRLHVICPCERDQDPEQYSLELPESLGTLVVCCGSAELICAKLRRYFDDMCSLGMFGNSLLEYFPLANGLQAGIDHAYHVFQNPVLVIDANFRIVAATWDAIEELGVHDSFVKNRQLDDANSGLVDLSKHEVVMRSEAPVKIFNKALGYDQLFCTIDSSRDLGHIVVSAVGRPINEMDARMLLVLKKFVRLKIAEEARGRGSKLPGHEYFLEGLLSGVVTEEHASVFALRSAQAFEGTLRCVVVDMARSDAPLGPAHVLSDIETRFPSARALIHDGNVVAVLAVPSQQDSADSQRQALERFAREGSLCAGASNRFGGIWQLPEHYRQALRAIDLGGRAAPGRAGKARAGEKGATEAGLRWYRDCAVTHLAQVFAEQESAEAFCHPTMRALLAYDRAHNSQLAYTLYMWLAHERNLSAAADAMTMHRSSLVYRFKKIHELVGDTFDDPTDRLYLMLSWELCVRNA